MDVANANIKLDFNDFSLLIYVVGGEKGEGEGILILFLNQDHVIRTISMDCCKSTVNGTNCNLLHSLLNRHKVKKIDCFVWTHPHDDHSNGLDELIDSHYRKGSIGILPKQIYGTNNDIVNMKPMSKRVLNKFNKKFRKKNLKSIDCQSREKRCVYSFDMEDIITGEVKNVRLYCLTPIDFLLDDKRRNDKKVSDSLLNDISLSLVSDVDGYCYFFGGDAPDKTLKETDLNYLYQCKWIKIPHHASKSTKKVIQYFNNTVDSAVATSFLKCKLPETNVLNLYKKKTNNLYVTQSKAEDTYDLGMIGYLYSFRDSAVQLKITRYGNACKY